LSRLLFYIVSVFIISFIFFFLGLLQIGGPGNANKDGVAFGLLSAIAWGLGSIGAPPRWSNRSNLFAALFAATSVGFFAPSDICTVGILSTMCDLRAAFAPASAVLQVHFPDFAENSSRSIIMQNRLEFRHVP
jgi:drug/metabolite transporter (DMT)-like permease